MVDVVARDADASRPRTAAALRVPCPALPLGDAPSGPALARLWPGSGPALARLWPGSGPALARLWPDSGPALAPHRTHNAPSAFSAVLSSDLASTPAAGSGKLLGMPSLFSRVFFSVVFVFALGFVARPARAADAGKPHEHQGLLKPFPRPPRPLALSAADQAMLSSGKPVMRLTEADAGGRGLAIFQVNAPADVVWATIRDFSSYPRFIPEVKKCDIYKKNGGNVDVDFVIKSYGVSLQYFIHHDIDVAGRWMTWTLDYGRASDLADSVGFWRVSPVEGAPDRALVEYSIDIAISGWVPGFVRSLLVDNGLKQATSWVKVQSEQRFSSQTSKPQ
jgi:ribosome-associated toxin RatA of RatAB toxin-antitoxin module